MNFNVSVLTIFPELFPGPLGISLTGKALEKKLWSLDVLDIRSFALDRHQTVDDTPAGGGAGMVMKPDVLGSAIERAMEAQPQNHLIYLSPRGVPLSQKKAKQLSTHSGLTLICGRYEGIDQRVLDEWNIEEVSIGDYVLTGGEIPAYTLIDACVRLQPGVVGAQESLEDESFSNGLLEYPHYTRPQVWKGREIPEILVSGHHENIRRWRLEESKKLTEERRQDLWLTYLSKKDSNYEYSTTI